MVSITVMPPGFPDAGAPRLDIVRTMSIPTGAISIPPKNNVMKPRSTPETDAVIAATSHTTPETMSPGPPRT